MNWRAPARDCWTWLLSTPDRLTDWADRVEAQRHAGEWTNPEDAVTDTRLVNMNNFVCPACLTPYPCERLARLVARAEARKAGRA